jgi:hypothetical protein
MNKDKLEVGDLVTYTTDPLAFSEFGEHYGIGLAVGNIPAGRNDDSFSTPAVLQIYWFKLGYVLDEWSTSLVKLCPTQEKENE